MLNIKLISLYMGIAFGIIFLIFTLIKYRKAPDFLEIAVMILSCTGAVIGIEFMRVVLSVDDGDLGKLVEYRVPIAIGALAVVWTSIGSLVKTCKQAIKSIVES